MENDEEQFDARGKSRMSEAEVGKMQPLLVT